MVLWAIPAGGGLIHVVVDTEVGEERVSELCARAVVADLLLEEERGSDSLTAAVSRSRERVHALRASKRVCLVLK